MSQHLRLADTQWLVSPADAVHETVKCHCQLPLASYRLLATDAQQSILQALTPLAHHQAYSPYGYCPDLHSELAFNGERPDVLTGHYHLGNGYRAFNPRLMRFNSPDILSPFSAGGLNSYAYCGGDPINRRDPSGHRFWGWIRNTVNRVTAAMRNALSQRPRSSGQAQFPTLLQHSTAQYPLVDLPPLPGVPTLKTLSAAAMDYHQLDEHLANGRLPPALHQQLTPRRPYTYHDWFRMQKAAPLPTSPENVSRTQRMIRENLDVLLAYEGGGSAMSKTRKVAIYAPGGVDRANRNADVWAGAYFRGERLLPGPV